MTGDGHGSALVDAPPLATLGAGSTALAGCYRFGRRTGSAAGSGEGDRLDRRIETHRTAPIDVTVVDRQGSPVEGARVDVAMQEHAFGFGTAVNAEYLVEETAPGDNYRTYVTDLFNKAVLENRHKWGFWEVERDRRLAEQATEWLLSKGLEMRGHTCIWQKRNQGAIPGDVVRAMNDDNGEYIERRADAHVQSITDHYAGVEGFTEWDVLNEQVAIHEMTDLIAPGEPPTRTPVATEWFRTAREAAPGVQLYLNEYNILTRATPSHRDGLEELVTYLLEEGAPLDGIGMQAHHWSVDHRLTSDELLDVLDRFADLGPSIQIQEYDTWGEGWTEAIEAEHLRRFLKTVYGHPAVEGFLMWGFWDEIHWQGSAPLFRSDWSRKPAHDVYTGLVFDRWWTDEQGRTDESGVFHTQGHLGTYEVTASASGATATTRVRVADPSATATVTLRLNR